MLENDPVLVTIADGEVQSIATPEIIADTEIEAFGTSSTAIGDEKKPGEVVVSGTEYGFNEAAQYDWDVLNVYTFDGGAVTNLKDTTYNIYLDQYGYVLGVEEVEASNNYVFITGVEVEGSLLGSNQRVTANAIFLDGTMDTIDINMKRSTGVPASGDALLNSWFTYTVSSSDVYTVRQVSDVKAASDESKAIPTETNGIRVAQYQTTISDIPGGDPEVIAIDDRHITVQGSSNTDTSAYYRVYGTDETVYLSVGLDVLNNGSYNVAYISEVNSVITGIGNASLEALSTEDAAAAAEDEANQPGIMGTPNNTNTSNGVYSLYNRDGDIIAAVVVGDDAGASTDLVYVDSGAVARESYNSSTDTYTWTRNVIIDGQRATLTEVGDGLSEIGGMTQDQWYQVKYDADGYVIDVELYSDALKGDDTVTDNGNEFVLDYKDIAEAVADEDVVLYFGTTPQILTSNQLELTGRTLWVDTQNDTGFRVAEDVNVALLQTNNNRNQTYFETGVSALRSMVNELNDRHAAPDTTHSYIISAILEDGVATSIVINDKSHNCDPYSDADYDEATGDLDLVSLGFDSTAGLTIEFGLQDENAVMYSYYDVRISVRTTDGARVYNGTVGNQLINIQPAGATDTVTFVDYKQEPSSANNYVVTLELIDGNGNVVCSGSDTLAAI